MSRLELSEDVSFGIGTVLVVESSSLEKSPQGGVIYTVVYRKSTISCVSCRAEVQPGRAAQSFSQLPWLQRWRTKQRRS